MMMVISKGMMVPMIPMTVRVIVTLLMVPMASYRLTLQGIGNIIHHFHRISMAIQIIGLLAVLVLFVGD